MIIIENEKRKKVSSLMVLLFLFLFFLNMSSCQLDIKGTQQLSLDNSEINTRALLSPGDMTNIAYAPDTLGCLRMNAAGKRFLHLQGSGYAMGFQHGYLLAASVQRMTSPDFVIAVLSNYTGITPTEFKTKVGTLVISQLISAFRSKSASLTSFIPSEYLAELRGIIDGAAARGYQVNYDDLLVLNTAFDILLGVAYPVIAPILGLGLSVPHMCDGFIVYGNGTTDGRTLMGRNFMFTDSILHEEMLLVEYCPASGNKMVSPTLPGWVGLVTGINQKGIGIGCDMAPAIAAQLSKVGMGIALTLRRALQYSNSLSQAIASVKSAELGISWIIAIGSGINEIGGAVIETAAIANKIRTTNYKIPLLYSLISTFPKQIEDKPDLVVFSNHFITPEMHLLAVNPAFDDSVWRYKTLTNLVLSNYSRIDIAKGKQLVDYLHPPAYNYYGTNTSASVKGCRALFDLKNLQIWSLFGHYNDPWMDYKF